MDNEALYFSALLASGTPRGLRIVSREHLSESWQAVYDWVVTFLSENGSLPRVETLKSYWEVELPDAAEGASYYAGLIRESALRVRLEQGFEAEVVKPLDSTRPDPSAALAGAKKVISSINRDFRVASSSLVLDDIGANVEERMKAYELREGARGATGIPLPWPTMTRCTSGIQPGEGWALLARPNIGKSFALIAIADYLYKLGYKVLFVSMETPPQGEALRSTDHRVVQGKCIRCHAKPTSDVCPASSVRPQRLTVRFDAIGAGVSAFRMLKGRLQPQEREALVDYYKKQADPAAQGWGAMRVIGAPAIRTVDDLEAELLSYQPDIVLWDSAYLAARGNKRDNAAQLVVEMRDLFSRTGIPGIISWHFNREVNEGAESASQNYAALTDELPRVFDVLLGLFRPERTVDAGEAVWQSLKVRDGVRMPELTTRFELRDTTDFSEVRGDG